MEIAKSLLIIITMLEKSREELLKAEEASSMPQEIFMRVVF